MTPSSPPSENALRALLRWYEDMGVDALVGAEPTDMSAWGAPPKLKAARSTRNAKQGRNNGVTAPQQFKSDEQRTRPAPPPNSATVAAPIKAAMPADEAALAAQQLAQSASTLEELRAAIKDFTGCPLKAGARNTVIDDGIDHAPLLILGEAPDRDEDRVGKPFVGRSGALLDAMLAAIQHRRTENTFMTTAIFWRPPGNRNPTPVEVAICLPFALRMIELQKPKIIITMGTVPTQTLFQDLPGITRARGTWQMHETSDGQKIPTLPLLHPAYLLRQPIQKKMAWTDLQNIAAKLQEISND